MTTEDTEFKIQIRRIQDLLESKNTTEVLFPTKEEILRFKSRATIGVYGRKDYLIKEYTTPYTYEGITIWLNEDDNLHSDSSEACAVKCHVFMYRSRGEDWNNGSFIRGFQECDGGHLKLCPTNNQYDRNFEQ